MDHDQITPVEAPEPREGWESKLRRFFSPHGDKPVVPADKTESPSTADSDITVRQAILPASAPFYLDIGCKTDRGQVRELNEDNALVWSVVEGRPRGGLFAVADGLGGRAGGEVASSLAVQKLEEQARADWPAEVADDGIRAAFQKWIQTANGEVYHAALAKQNGMATTLTAALVLERRIHVANVGDSRTYLWRAGQLQRITHDHSLVMKLVDSGTIKPEEIYTHPRRNEIYRALGVAASVEVDIFGPLELAPPDRLLLCSDGLWERVHDEQLQDVLSHISSSQAACEELVRLANQYGGQDNITALIVRLT